MGTPDHDIACTCASRPAAPSGLTRYRAQVYQTVRFDADGRECRDPLPKERTEHVYLAADVGAELAQANGRCDQYLALLRQAREAQDRAEAENQRLREGVERLTAEKAAAWEQAMLRAQERDVALKKLARRGERT